MRRSNGLLIVLVVVGLGAALLLRNGIGVNANVGLRHNFHWDNPPTGLQTYVTTPWGRRWKIDRTIQYHPHPQQVNVRYPGGRVNVYRPQYRPYCPPGRPCPWPYY